ncbi:MAG: SDR family NAD(P)-dependent oxidoreductase, partial [Acidimicrobiia bacterium]|nr:SDR family NAD(P)-dependent oxidoreductase [Acidimicrobiia bacterium]
MARHRPHGEVFDRALVTGASSGIGEAFVEVLRAAGVPVVAVARRVDRLEALAARLGEIEVLAADLTTPEGLAAVEARIIDERDPIDLVVNNAAFGTSGPFVTLDVDRLVTGFVHVLRRGGMSITISQSTLFRAALDVVGLSEGLDVYWAGRSTLVLKQEHVAMYDAMFLAFFHHNTSGFSMRFDDVAELMDQLASDDGDDSGGDGGGDEETEVLRFSRTERLQEKDFGDFDEAELREAERAMAQLRVRPATRRSRRRRRSNHGDAHDLRRTVRAAMRRGGEPIDLLTTKTGDRN